MTKIRTAIFIMPPENVQIIAGALRKKYWPDSQSRIGAHISILSPFVSYKKIKGSAEKLASICKNISPYEIKLHGYGEFQNYIYMKITNPLSIKTMFKKILSIFPECLPYDGKYGTDLHPHISVGKFLNEEAQHRAQLPSYIPLKFTVDNLHIMYTDDKMTMPWKQYSIVYLGK